MTADYTHYRSTYKCVDDKDSESVPGLNAFLFYVEGECPGVWSLHVWCAHDEDY